MPTTPPYNMHAIIGYGEWVFPGGWLSNSNARTTWETGAEWVHICPDLTCDGPTGYANVGNEPLGCVSPGESEPEMPRLMIKRFPLHSLDMSIERRL